MEEIWRKWERHYNESGMAAGTICKDGIIDNEKFSGILFVLKEARLCKRGKEIKDIRDLYRLRPSGIGMTLAIWAYGIHNNWPPFEEVIDSRIELLHQQLTQTAVINLKKTVGERASDISVVNAYANHDRALLREQIYMIRPRVIIACGVADLLIWLLKVKVISERPKEQPIKMDNMWMVPSRSPTRNVVEDKRTYNMLREMFKKIDDMKRIRI